MAWNRPSDKKVERKGGGGQRNVHLKGLVAGLIVVIGAAVAARWLVSDSTPPPSTSTSTSTSLIKAVTPSAAPKYVEREARREALAPRKPKMPTDPGSLANIAAKEAFLARARGNPETMFAMTNRNFVTDNVYHTRVEQLLTRLFCTKFGEMPPVPPGDIPEDERSRLVEILISDVKTLETDSDLLAYNKETIRLAKKEMMKFVREGGDPQEFIDYYYRQLHQAYNRRNDAAEVVENACRTEDAEVARELYGKVNEMLEKDGIPGVEIPLQYRAKLGIFDEGQQEE